MNIRNLLDKANRRPSPHNGGSKTVPSQTQFHLGALRLYTQCSLSYPPWQSAFSEDALHRAWLSVRANKGAATGRDSVRDFENALTANLKQLQDALLSHSYRPHPVKQILVPKSGDDWRPITLWTVVDRVVQRAVYNYLEPVWDPFFLDSSHGFRPNRSVGTAVQAIQMAYQQGARQVVEADIQDCFGSLDNARLLRLLRQWNTPAPIYQLLDHWLHARIVNAWRGRNCAGASQGGVISPLLCNLYLHSLDRALQRPDWRLVRYADDFVVLAMTSRSAQAALKHTTHTLRQIGLQIHPHKTHLTTFDAGFQFVGWFFIRDEVHQLR